MLPISNISSITLKCMAEWKRWVSFPGVHFLVNKARLLTFLCMFLWFHVFRRVSVSDQTFKHPSPNPQEKGGNAKIQNRHQSRLHCCRSYRQIQQTQSFRLGFLTDYTINKGYGCMTAYHEKGRERGAKGGKHGPVYLSSRCWRPEESVWLRGDTNGTTQRRDKALRHFLLIKFNKPHLRHTGIQCGAFREKVNTSIL